MKKARVQMFVALSALFVLAFILYGQQPAPPLIRSTSRLVLLDVIVTDKEGKPVRHLTRNDFTVLENGVPQTINSFESPAADVESVHTADSAGAVAPKGNAPSKNAEFAVGRSRTIILLDQLNTAFADLASARDSIVRFLHEDVAQDQPIALMAVQLRGLTVVQDYTTDRKLLEDKLLHLTPLNVNSKGNMDLNWAPEYAQAAMGDLTQIARASVGAPYSVNVIWLTSGFSGMLSYDKRNDQLDAGLRRVTNFLIRSRMRLYTIDPAGVVAKVPPGGLGIPNIPSGANVRDPNAASANRIINSAGTGAAEADVLLARMTKMMGGLSYYGRNDVSKALGQAVLDGSSAYLLSYSPSNTDFEGEYRKIEVRTNIAGSFARTRPGYYAVADEAAVDKQVSEARLQTAMESSLVYSGVDLACPATFDPHSDRLTGKMVISPRPLLAAADAHEQVLRMSSFSKNGKPLDAWSWRVNWKDPWTNRVVSASFDKVLSPKAVKVRFMVSDPAADRIGTCEHKLP